MIVKETHAEDCEAVFAHLTSSKQKRLKLNIPDTIFISAKGLPISRYANNQQGIVRRWPAQQLKVALYDDFRLSTVSARADAIAQDASTPVAIARYRATSNLLTADDLAHVLRNLTAFGIGSSNAVETLQIPWCLQAYVPPADDRRYVTSYMWTDTNVVCETFQSEYSRAYPLLEEPLGHFKPPSAQDSVLYDVGASFQVSPQIGLQVRQSVLATVNFVRSAHSTQLMGIVLEHVLDASHQLYFNACFAVCWPEEKRPVHSDSMRRLFCTLPDIPSSSNPSQQPSTASVDTRPSTHHLGTPKTPRVPAFRDLNSASNGVDGASSSEAFHHGSSTARGAHDSMPPSVENSQAFIGSESSRSSHFSPHKGKRFGLDSTLAAMLSPRYSEASMWGSKTGPGPHDAMNRGAAALVNTGRPPPTFTMGGGSHKCKRHCCKPFLIGELSYRLEEVRLALQDQLQAATLAARDELRWRDISTQADRDRQAATDQLAALSTQHAEEMAILRQDFANLRHNYEAKLEQTDKQSVDLAALQQENSELKERLQYERNVSFNVTGDLQKRLGCVQEELTSMSRVSVAQIESMKSETNATKRDFDAEQVTSRALALQLKTVEDKVKLLEQETHTKTESILALSRERDELLRSLPELKSLMVDKPLLAPEEIEDLLLKEVNPGAEFQILSRILRENAIILRQVFRWYANYRNEGSSVIGSKSKNSEGFSETITNTEFHRFCRDCGVMDKLDTLNLDQIFIKVNFEGQRGVTGDKVLEFAEFLEALIRMGNMRYPNFPHISQSLQELFDKNLTRAKRAQFVGIGSSGEKETRRDGKREHAKKKKIAKANAEAKEAAKAQEVKKAENGDAEGSSEKEIKQEQLEPPSTAAAAAAPSSMSTRAPIPAPPSSTNSCLKIPESPNSKGRRHTVFFARSTEVSA
ncbi:hypothetical protein CYMTET_44712 [Cymbomonas tetramitiformis]|uniref:Uncharacterized protein n=1 Tax=Cymbomonas tetramitiformis TaxID=36881 RepID=A0AAE0EZC2_9CHLO|nr:hypothetical protein CYMTET_44712 [Cymbomonas tetramitiformis]